MEMAKPPGTQWVSPHTLSIHTYHRTQQSYSWARSQTNENICSHENLYVLHWKLETIQLSLSEESATQTVRAHPLEGNSKIETRGGLNAVGRKARQAEKTADSATSKPRTGPSGCLLQLYLYCRGERTSRGDGPRVKDYL